MYKKKTDTTAAKAAEVKDETKKKEKEVLDLATATLTGDIRDFLLDRVKTMGKPWVAMSEDEQRDSINQCKSAAEHLVGNAVKIIAGEGRKAMVGQLIKVQLKDKIQAQVDFSKMDEQRHELMDSVGSPVLLIVADAEQFTGERGPAEPTPDQGTLIEAAEKLKKKDDKVEKFPK